MFFWRMWGNHHAFRRVRGVIDCDPLYMDVVTPEEFIDLYKRDPDNIESVAPIPGVLGTDDFGSFVIRRKRSGYVPSLTDPAFGK